MKHKALKPGLVFQPWWILTPLEPTKAIVVSSSRSTTRYLSTSTTMPTSTQKRPRQDADSPGSLSESASLKRHRKNASTPSLQSSDRVTSPINSDSGTGTSTSSSSPGSSSDENSHDRPRASNLVYRRRARVRERREEAEEDDNTSSDESSSPESASSDVDSDSDTDEDDKSSSERETPLPRLPVLQKPQIHRVNRDPDLLARVSSFLPRMKAANDSLQRSIAEGRSADLRVDHVGEGYEGSYIEMVCCVLSASMLVS
mgnify:CR=1 FL=1